MSTRRQPRLYLVLPAILRLCEKQGTQGAAPASDPVAAAVARAFPPVLAAPPRVRRHAVRLLGRLCARLGARRHRDGALTSPCTSLHPLAEHAPYVDVDMLPHGFTLLEGVAKGGGGAGGGAAKRAAASGEQPTTPGKKKREKLVEKGADPR